MSFYEWPILRLKKIFNKSKLFIVKDLLFNYALTSSISFKIPMTSKSSTDTNNARKKFPDFFVNFFVNRQWSCVDLKKSSEIK